MDIYYDEEDSDEEYSELKKVEIPDHVYESVTEKPVANQGPTDGFNISKKCLILILVSVFVGLLLILGTSVTISYQLGKGKGVKISKEGCQDGWFNISNECFKFADNACTNGCTWKYSVEVCKNLGGKLADQEVMKQCLSF